MAITTWTSKSTYTIYYIHILYTIVYIYIHIYTPYSIYRIRILSNYPGPPVRSSGKVELALAAAEPEPLEALGQKAPGIQGPWVLFKSPFMWDTDTRP